MGYLLFGGRTRQMTQYAATAVADIDPDVCGAWNLGKALAAILGFNKKGSGKCYIATNSVQRAKGPEVQTSSRTIFAKAKKEDSSFDESLVAEMGFEPHDLRVMSPTSYQTAPLRDTVVPEAGVEPVREKISRDFKSRASANSAIPAYATVLSQALLVYYITLSLNCQYLFAFLLKNSFYTY